MMQLSSTGFVSLCACLLLTGCASPGLSSKGHAVSHLSGADRTAAFGRAELALTGLGYQIERRDASSGVLTAHPASGERPERPNRQSRRLSSDYGTRLVAEVRVEQVGETVSVYCQVLVQEQTTQAHRLLTQDRRGYDTPTDTAIDREAAATARQNTVWRTVRRDRDAERQILAAMVEANKPTG